MANFILHAGHLRRRLLLYRSLFSFVVLRFHAYVGACLLACLLACFLPSFPSLRPTNYRKPGNAFLGREGRPHPPPTTVWRAGGLDPVIVKKSVKPLSWVCVCVCVCVCVSQGRNPCHLPSRTKWAVCLQSWSSAIVTRSLCSRANWTGLDGLLSRLACCLLVDSQIAVSPPWAVSSSLALPVLQPSPHLHYHRRSYLRNPGKINRRRRHHLPAKSPCM
ncbi:hypothetical protein IWZ03DRAFT_386345 [Phyllosticta citriasiana]|uniref:Uncharacterized protein n=1 Tax=Phyllosticta citriasiana TaxID=595635 RepID=A0ABR1KD75_9PEZI